MTDFCISARPFGCAQYRPYASVERASRPLIDKARPYGYIGAMEKAMENIFRVNLAVRPGERVLVFTDTLGPEETVDELDAKRREATTRVARRIAGAGRRFARCEFVSYPSVGSHGAEPPPVIWEKTFGAAVVKKLKQGGALERILLKKTAEGDMALAEGVVREFKNDAIDCIVALSNYSTSHTSFRRLATRTADVRYASMPVFEEAMLAGVMTADWKEVERRTVRLARVMSGGETVHVTTPLGTDITFSIKGRPVKADTGMLAEAGSFSNLPAGEAYVAPVEGTAEGALVLEWAPMRKLKSPVTLIVREGLAREVRGDEGFARELAKTLEANPLFGNIAELGVGTNDRATRPDNILEGEKILGTVHMALGDNSTFGGKVSVPFHQDFIFFHPTMTVEKDGKRIEILREGRPVW